MGLVVHLLCFVFSQKDTHVTPPRLGHCDEMYKHGNRGGGRGRGLLVGISYSFPFLPLLSEAHWQTFIQLLCIFQTLPKKSFARSKLKSGKSSNPAWHGVIRQ